MTREITVKVTGFEKKEIAALFLENIMKAGVLNSDRSYDKKRFPEVNNGKISFVIKND